MKVALLTKSVSSRAGGLLPVLQRLGSTLSESPNNSIFALGIEDNGARDNDTAWGRARVQVFKHRGPAAFGCSRAMVNALAEIRPDIVHTHGLFYYTSAIAFQWGKKNNRPYLVSPHGMLDAWALGNSRWKKILAGWMLEDKHLRNARCVHSLCAAETISIRAYGLKNPVCQIPNGIDLPKCFNKLRAPWDGKLEGKKKILLYLGRIHPKKGLPALLTAWASAVQEVRRAKEWVLCVAGWDQGGHEKELMALTKALDLDEVVCFIGPQFNEFKVACYQNAEGFILPSYSEGLPMVILEAWAFGLPVLMTKQCNLPEGFEKGAAIRIETDPKAITRGLLELFEMSDCTRKEMGQRGLLLVKEQFSWPKVAAQMRQVYDWLVRGGTPPECVRFD